MTDAETPRDPRAMDDDELAEVPVPPPPADPSLGSEAVAEDEYAEGTTNDPDGAHRDEPAGEDYAGSGF
ncbi:hypothetical protein [uncultured Friedmanniella sp.]|uniref:hypothetical protein n=1 Tax=uncultured Friedmanniella sp. TaxID=335381 RepID=UPI0035CAF776